MASDDRRSDDPAADARARFSIRTFLTPEDGETASGGEPGDGATVDHGAPETFGTGGADDAALDALVLGDASADTDAQPSFVWAASEVPTLSVDEDEAGDASAVGSEALLDGGEASSDDSEAAPIAAPLAGGEPAVITEARADEFVSDPFAAPAPDDSAPEEAGTAEPDAPSDDDHVAAEASGVPSEEPRDPFQTASAAEPEGAEPAPPTDAAESLEDEGPDPFAQAGLDESPAGALDGSASDDGPSDPDLSAKEDAEGGDLEDAAVTAAVDHAFELETDEDKAETASVGEPEGTLEVAPLGPDDFEPDTLRTVLRTMMTSRRLDHKMLTLLKQGKGFFHIGSAGHEASQIAVGGHFKGGRDWFCLYYRDLATALTIGVTPTEVLRAHFGKAADVFGGGRQMPEHFGHRALNVLSTSSSVAAQYVPAVGFALAVKREDGEAVAQGTPSRAVYASGGEGSTSQGAFHEALNWAAREALPVLFHVQDNKYAISVPVEEQTAGGSIWHLLGGYAGLERIRYDGTDFFQSAAAARAAMDHIRAGKGPVALHADLVRLLPHSSSDDHRKYREAASIEADIARDPIPRFAARLVEAGILTDAEVDALEQEVAAEVDRIARAVEAEPDPDPADATRHVYYEGPDEREYEADGETGDLVVMVDAINHALDEEMARDPRVLVYGEDVGGGKGGVFTATRGLTERHGRDRCFNSPLAEHSVIGSAVGLAAAGYMPVVEIQFADYIWPGMQPLRNQVASMRYRSNNEWACPMVLRVPCGGYIHGGLCHSQNIEAIFGHWPGLHVVMPSNAADAKGLLKTAIRGHDPVLFLEHKALYRQGPARRPEPHADYLVPLGTAAVVREGTDLTIVTWGAIVYKALNVAKALEKEGVSVEVVDVRSILPFDRETVLASARKTGRVLVAYEDHEFMGFGAEVAAQVSDAAFGHLDAPVKRVAGAFSSIPYADVLEKEVLPQDDDILAAAREVLEF
ncbi:thiamine pyrophosphate-dependent enzyme [Rubrivirga sp.]|uniref:thiamine pyrophosphate-dependent enzyme n=1 Tax=Rubrivirga sp. TaxID=1885344 RepID=UPI003B51ED59